MKKAGVLDIPSMRGRCSGAEWQARAVKALVAFTAGGGCSPPLAPATRGLLDAQAIAALPLRAQLVNVARGEIVDEDALVAALQQGSLAGAFLAVFAQEPLRNPAID